MVSFILDRVLTRSERVSDWMFASMLMGISIMVKAKRLLVPSFRRRLDEKHFTAQIKVRGNAIGRTFIFRNGKFSSLDGVGPEADICMIFRDTASAVQLMAASTNYLKQINAMKNFVVDVEGPDEYAVWFMQTIKMLQRIRSEPVCGIPMGGGALCQQHQWRTGVRLCAQRQNHPYHPGYVRRAGRPSMDHPCAGQKLHAARQGNGQSLCFRT